MVPRALRNWLRHPLESARWTMRDAAFRAGRTTTVRMRDDWTVRCHPASVDAFAVQRDQPELAEELRTFIAHCSRDMVLVDIGAHFGLFTLAALRFSDGTAHVVAVDPSEDAMRLFDANVELAGGRARVEGVRAAVTRDGGTLSLLTTGATAFHMMVPASAVRADAVVVSGVTLDSLVASRGLAPTHLKIDVEGWEEAVLDGGQRVLRECRPMVFLELHGWMVRRAAGDPFGAFRVLAGCGYRRCEIGGRAIEPADAAAMDMARVVCFPEPPTSPPPHA